MHIQEAQTPRHIPWYQGGYKGVRLDKAIRYHGITMREAFRSNPYGLNARWYFFIILAYFAFMYGNLLLGYAETREKQKRAGLQQRSLKDDSHKEERLHLWIPLLKGWVASFPVVWMSTLFFFPPLIANAREQMAAMGLEMSD